MRFGNAMRVHKAQQIVGKLAYGEWRSTPRRPPVPPGIQGIYVEMPGELRDLPREIVAVLAVAVQQDQRLALTFVYVEMFDIHH